MYVAQITILGEDGPEDRILGPFVSQEELEEFVMIYDLECEWYAKLVPPDLFVEETITVN